MIFLSKRAEENLERIANALDKLAGIEIITRDSKPIRLDIEVEEKSLEELGAEEDSEARDAIANKISNSRYDPFWQEDNLTAEELERMQS